MKKNILIIVFILLAGIVSAGRYEVAFEKAQAFFGSNKKYLHKSAEPLTCVYTSPQKELFGFNRGVNKGFVIVGEEILGYSYTGHFPTVDSLPANVQFWLKQYAVRKAVPVTTVTPVAPLLGDIQWNQSPIYNDSCPVADDGTLCVTGCVATAGVQVMGYYKHPSQGVGNNTYTWDRKNGQTVLETHTLSCDFSTHTYDWSLWQPKYTSSSSSAQKGFIARLMRDAGYACDMQYNTNALGGSAAYGSDMARGLITHFGYSPAIHCRLVDYDNSDSLLQAVVVEFVSGRPILVSGTSENGGGHAFVFDGIDSDGKVHVNWGWGGLADGYYTLIGGLNPAELGAGAGYGKYNKDVSLIMGIEPASSGSQDTAVSVGIASNFVCSQNGFLKTETTTVLRHEITSLYNFGWNDWVGAFAFTAYNQQGRIRRNNLLQNTYYLYKSKYIYSDKLIYSIGANILAGTLADGVYALDLCGRQSLSSITVYPLYDELCGTLKHVFVVTPDSVYFYRASQYYREYVRDVETVYNSGTGTLSWNTDGSTVRIVVWDADGIHTYRSTTGTIDVPCRPQAHYALFATDENDALIDATSAIVYGQFPQEVHTSVDEVEESSVSSQKVYEAGQVFILRDGKKYTSTGVLVQ